MADVVIVGGGVIGCASAHYLTKAGAGVALLEKGEVAGEASGAAAGMLVPPPWAAASGDFRDLCLASLRLYPALVGSLLDETSIDVQYLEAGLLVPAESEPAAAALRQVACHGGDEVVPLEWVEGEPLRRLEPGLSPALPGAAYSPSQRHVNPGLLTQALARGAVGRGATLRQGAGVSAFLRRGGRVTGVRTGAGDTVAADYVVLAAGSWTGRLARRLGAKVPTPPMRGQMLAYRSNAVRHMIWGEDGYLVPKAGGFLFAGATVEDAGFRPRTTGRGLAGLRRMARSIVPSLRHGEVASAWAGLRPGSPDGLPVIGRLPGWENVYVATGHFRNGILLGPITGKLIAQLITGGRTEVPLAPFDPARFS
ncbi:MAG: glycine oxidase ThiO [Dehalococcoidia bacterium]|nr:glycine oxidase ThiO [Dehalococcoidia bacterium]